MKLITKQRESLLALPIAEPNTATSYSQAVAKKIKFDKRYILEVDYFDRTMDGWKFQFREFYFSVKDYYQQDSKNTKIRKGETPFLLKRNQYYYVTSADAATQTIIARYFKINVPKNSDSLSFFKTFLELHRERKDKKLSTTGISNSDIDKLPIPDGVQEFAREWKEKNDFVGIMKAKSHYKYPCTCQHCGEKFNAYRKSDSGYNRHKVPSITIPDYGFWNKKYQCPGCGNKLELLYFNDSDYRVAYAENISFFQKIKDVLILRTFHINRDEAATLEECGRLIMADNTNEHHRKTSHWLWHMSSYSEPCWERYSQVKINQVQIGLLWKPSVQELKFTRYDIPLVFERLLGAKDHSELKDALQLIAVIKSKNSYLMTLYKKGYIGLADDIILYGAKLDGLKRNGKSVSEILNIDMGRLQSYGDRKKLTCIKVRICNMLHGCNKPSDLYDKIMKVQRFHEDTRELQECFKVCKPTKLVNYCLKQKISFHDYLDLIHQYERLGFTLTENLLYPKSYQQVHTELNELENKRKSEMEMKKLKEKDEAFSKAVKKYSKMEFEADGLLISVIKTATELKTEAIGMHNCSAGYVDRIINGNCVIFKIRQKDKPDDFFCMLELSRDFRIVQCRGIRNSQAPQEVSDFLQKWKACKFKKAA